LGRAASSQGCALETARGAPTEMSGEGGRVPDGVMLVITAGAGPS
jgi:hypothetical protein